MGKDGYIMVKVREWPTVPQTRDNWRFKHWVEWERANGQPVPDGWTVFFADGDKRNFDPDNLIAVPRGVWSTIKRLGFQYGDAESLQTAVALARLAQVRNETRSRARKARKEKKRK
jgi:hypothetical protein